MNKTIHPTWDHNAVVTCSCGHSFTTGSTTSTLQVDICSNCHPFFTGEMKFVDRQGRVDAFYARQKKAAAARSQRATKGKKTSTAQQSQQDPKSYQDLLREQRVALKKQQSAAA